MRNGTTSRIQSHCGRRLCASASIVALALAGGLVATTNVAHAHTVNYYLCASAIGTYTDNGFSEDEWTSDLSRPFIGAWADVFYDSSCSSTGTTWLWTGLLDASGCTPAIATSHHDCLVMKVVTAGALASGNSLNAYDSSGGASLSTVYAIDPPDSGGVWPVLASSSSTKNIYLALAHIIQNRYRGTMANEVIRAYATNAGSVCGCSGSASRFCMVGDEARICLHPDDASRKWVMAHEYGHANLELTTDLPIVGGVDPCAYTYPGQGAGHSPESLEDGTCAMLEGWGYFVAIDSWNDHSGISNPDAYMYTLDANICDLTDPNPYTDVVDQCPGTDNPNIIDIEDSGCQDNCVVAFMETNYPSSYWDTEGRATEIDWYRTYWDYHTNDPGVHSGPPGHLTLEGQWASTPNTNITATNLYDKFRKGAAAYSGCDAYERLVYYADANGTNHCSGGCDAVGSGCTDCDATGCPP